MDFGKVLARLRKEKGITQGQAADYISLHSEKACSFKVISHWENGVSSPSVQQFLLLCEYYDVTDIQATFRDKAGRLDNSLCLNDLGRSRAQEYISLLLTNPNFMESPITHINEVVPASPSHSVSKGMIKVYTIPVSAGLGSFLDDENYDEIDRDDTVPESADFAVRVSGDSMEPRFYDGQVIFIKEQQAVEVGEIGIFSLNGDAYVKKLAKDSLISLNSRYSPILLREYDNLHVFGKVVG